MRKISKKQKLKLYLIFFNLLIICLFAIFISDYTGNFSLPNTFVGNQNVSGKTKKEVREIIQTSFQTDYQIQIKDRIYRYSLSEIGVLPDLNKLTDEIFKNTKRKLPFNAILFFKALWFKNIILPKLIFDQDFYRFTKNTVFDLSYANDVVVVDEEDKLLSYFDNEEKYQIESIDLQKIIINNFGNTGNILKPKLIKVTDKKGDLIKSFNQKLLNVYQEPVMVVISNGDNQTQIIIDPVSLKKFTSLNYDMSSDNLKINVNYELLDGFVNQFIITLNADPDRNISFTKLHQDIVYLINARFYGDALNSIIAKIDYSPNTKGEKADKYLEIDLSQQRMYLFQEGENQNSFRISTGLDYPTPVGEYKIINKFPNAYSKIFNVWMPYWMAFHYSKELDAYLGIHELPYYLTSSGVKILRPRENIGAPHTGGCIALDIGEAEQVYDFANEGLPVFIYK